MPLTASQQLNWTYIIRIMITSTLLLSPPPIFFFFKPSRSCSQGIEHLVLNCICLGPILIFFFCKYFQVNSKLGIKHQRVVKEKGDMSPEGRWMTQIRT